MSSFSGTKPEPTKRTTNVSTHASVSAPTPNQGSNKEANALSAMTRITDPLVKDSVKRGTKERQEAAVASYHKNPEQAQEDAQVDSILTTIFGPSVETEAINKEIAQQHGTLFTQEMLKFANDPLVAKLSASDFQAAYNSRLESMLESGDFDQAQMDAVRGVTNKYFPRVASQQSRSNLKYQQEAGAKAAHDTLSSTGSMTDFTKGTETAEFKETILDKAYTMGSGSFNAVASGVVMESLASGDESMYQFVMNDEQVKASFNAETLEKMEVAHDKWKLGHDKQMYEFRRGLADAQSRGDVGKTEQYVNLINGGLDSDQKMDLNTEKLKAQAQADRLYQAQLEAAKKGPSDTQSMDAMLLERATASANQYVNNLLDKQEKAGLNSGERTALTDLQQQLETGLSRSQVMRYILDDTASALTVMNMAPNVQSSYVSDITNKLSMTAPQPGESPEQRQAREQEVFEAMELYQRMNPQLRKSYVKSQSVRDFTELFKQQHGITDTNHLTDKFATTNILMEDTTDYSAVADEDVAAAAEQYVEELNDSLGFMEELDETAVARIKAQYSQNFRKHGPDYAKMLSNRQFKDDTVMFGDATFTGMAGANKGLRDAGMNMNVVDFVEATENTDSSFAESLEEHGIDLDEGNFSMTYTPSLNAVSIVGHDGVPVTLPLPRTWEDFYGGNQTDADNLKRFNIKNDFAPVVNQVLGQAITIPSDMKISDEIRKEYNVRSKDSLISATMVKATILADAAGLSDEAAASYLDEVYLAAANVSDEKNRKMQDKQYKNMGSVYSALDAKVYDIPGAPAGFGKSLISRYRSLINSGKVTDTYK